MNVEDVGFDVSVATMSDVESVSTVFEPASAMRSFGCAAKAAPPSANSEKGSSSSIVWAAPM